VGEWEVGGRKKGKIDKIEARSGNLEIWKSGIWNLESGRKEGREQQGRKRRKEAFIRSIRSTRSIREGAGKGILHPPSIHHTHPPYTPTIHPPYTILLHSSPRLHVSFFPSSISLPINHHNHHSTTQPHNHHTLQSSSSSTLLCLTTTVKRPLRVASNPPTPTSVSDCSFRPSYDRNTHYEGKIENALFSQHAPGYRCSCLAS